MEDWHIPSQPGALPPARRVLVFAPHPDDEVFGCGGVLALYAQSGAQVQVVVVSDGAAQVSAEQRDSHFQARAAESRAALACLGVADVEFWGLADRSLSGDERLAERILRCMRSAQADVVLAPSLWEIHPDHVAVGRSVMLALRDAGAQPITGLFYEVGAAQRVNLLVDVSAVWQRKANAMACFASQQERQDYARHIEALNAWRTYTLPAEVRYAEGLTTVTVDAVQQLAGESSDPVAQFIQHALRSAAASADIAYEQLRQQLQGQHEAMAKSLAEFHEVLAQREATICSLQDAVDHQGAALAKMASSITEQAALIAELQRHAAALQDRAAQAEALGADLRGHLDAVRGSTSWRITAPLRWLSRTLRGR